ITLDEGDNIAVPVDHGEVRGVTGGWTSSICIAVGLLRVDPLCALCRIFLREQTGNRNLCKARIGVVPRQVGVCQLHRFDSLVPLLGAERSSFGWRDLLEDIQHFKSCHALAVWRQFVDLPSAVSS